MIATEPSVMAAQIERAMLGLDPYEPAFRLEDLAKRTELGTLKANAPTHLYYRMPNGWISCLDPYGFEGEEKRKREAKGWKCFDGEDGAPFYGSTAIDSYYIE